MKKAIIFIGVVLLTACSVNKQELIGSWVEPIPGMEDQKQGISIQEDGSASSINMHTLVYTGWQLDGNKLLLSGASVGNGQTINFTDTAKIVKLTPDSLVLKSHDYYTRYARLKE